MDFSVCVDLELWIDRLVLEGDLCYTYIVEGLDDMLVHFRSVVIKTLE